MRVTLGLPHRVVFLEEHNSTHNMFPLTLLDIDIYGVHSQNQEHTSPFSFLILSVLNFTVIILHGIFSKAKNYFLKRIYSSVIIFILQKQRKNVYVYLHSTKLLWVSPVYRSWGCHSEQEIQYFLINSKQDQGCGWYLGSYWWSSMHIWTNYLTSIICFLCG